MVNPWQTASGTATSSRLKLCGNGMLLEAPLYGEAVHKKQVMGTVPSSILPSVDGWGYDSVADVI